MSFINGANMVSLGQHASNYYYINFVFTRTTHSIAQSLLRQRGRVSVTRRYCVYMVKPILKLFQPFCRSIILVFSDPCTNTQFQV